jgi:hypothetical protein
MKCIDDPRGFQFCSRTCATTSDCQNQMTCQAGVCRAAPEMMSGGDVKGGCTGAPGLWLLGLLLLVRAPRREACIKTRS